MTRETTGNDGDSGKGEADMKEPFWAIWWVEGKSEMLKWHIVWYPINISAAKHTSSIT